MIGHQLNADASNFYETPRLYLVPNNIAIHSFTFPQPIDTHNTQQKQSHTLPSEKSIHKNHAPNTQHLRQLGTIAARQSVVLHGHRRCAMDLSIGPPHRMLMPVRARILGTAPALPSHGAALRAHHGGGQPTARIPHRRLHRRVSAILPGGQRLFGPCRWRSGGGARHAHHVDRLHSSKSARPCRIGEWSVEQYAAGERKEAARSAEAVCAFRVSDGREAVPVDVF